jgi:NADH-quinone oxidoreductase subunit L
MCRLYFLTFWGDFRGWKVGRPSVIAREEAAAAASAPHAEGESHHAEDLSQPGYPPHETPWQMTVPLIVLGAFSIFAGFLNPGFHLYSKPLDHWLEPVFKSAVEGAVVPIKNAESLELPLAFGGVLAFAIGTGLAWWIYVKQNGAPARQLAAAVPGVHQFLLDKWRVDEFYDATVIAGVDSLAETSAVVDKTIVDGILARVTAVLVAAAGTILRAFQNGVVHMYAALMVVGIAAVSWFFAMAHANATVVDAGNDDYVITAAPGVGYAYRWDADGDGKPDKPDFGDTDTVKIHVEAGKTTTVNLEVKNAFGFMNSKSFKVARPAAPISSL